MGVHVCLWVHVHMCVHYVCMCIGQRSTLDIFLSHSPPYVLVPSFSLKLELTNRLGGWPGHHGDLQVPSSPHRNCRCTLPQSASLWSLGNHDCTARTFPTEPSAQPSQVILYLSKRYSSEIFKDSINYPWSLLINVIFMCLLIIQMISKPFESSHV